MVHRDVSGRTAIRALLGSIALLAALAAIPAGAAEGRPSAAEREEAADAAPEAGAPRFIDPCVTIEQAARAHGIPVEFLTRLIWQESSFRPNAVSPAGAQGIAQFMPGTAAERGLVDPFEPVQAIFASAHLLADLRAQFGNFGLAAAAYNGGPTRVANWLAGTGSLPYETQRYVEIVTRRSADDWTGEDRQTLDYRLGLIGPSTASCAQIRTALVRTIPTMVATTPIRSPWGVQLAGSFRRGAALNLYANLKLRYGAVLAGYDPMVISKRRRSRGTRPFNQVRVGAPSREAANKLCGSIRAAGGYCLVMRN